MQYVLGFAFCDGHVALILKKRGPEALIGNWNGIGGKIEEGELAVQAMVREFYEECSYVTEQRHWNFFGDYRGRGWAIALFRINLRRQQDGNLPTIMCKELGGEFVSWFKADLSDCVSPQGNLRWLIPMALYTGANSLDIYEE
ncbi:NUDIX hydrolase protein [Rhizobium phage RHph_I1_18]|nr:NUDIX hydrolase protein [Rhizobium phage RHph_I1_18]